MCLNVKAFGAVAELHHLNQRYVHLWVLGRAFSGFPTQVKRGALLCCVGDVSKRPVETCSIEQVHRGLAVKPVGDKR
jgi:hypothetical protein